MPRMTLNHRRHDPFWDLEGTAVRHARSQQRLFQAGLVFLVVLFLGTVFARLPGFDPQLVTTNGSLRPVLAVALTALLLSCILVAANRFRVRSTWV